MPEPVRNASLEHARLDEFTKDEWREVARKVAPWMTDEQYEEAWEDVMRQRHLRSLH